MFTFTQKRRGKENIHFKAQFRACDTGNSSNDHKW